MIWIVRVGLVFAWGWVLKTAATAAINAENISGPSIAGYFGLLILLGIPVAAVWVPVIGRFVLGKAVDSVGDDHYTHSRNWLAAAIEAAVNRGERKKVVFLCWLETWINPKLRRPNSIGMEHAVPGSRLELHFARRLFRCNNAADCIRAADVIEKHGYDPGLHNSEAISQMLMQRKKIRRQERLRLKAEKARALQAEAEGEVLEDPPGSNPDQ